MTKWKVEREDDCQWKMVIVGDTGVGKSCVVTQFMEQKMSMEHEVTLGVEFASRTVKCGSKTLKLQVWDTAGQQNFRSITRSYYRSAVGALLIYDITKKKTFEHLKEWLTEIRSNASEKLEVLLIGNKTDLEPEREVSAADGRRFADQNALQWTEISAKQYSRVENAFLKLARVIVDRIERGEITETTAGVKILQSSRIDPLGDSERGSSRCC